jgi:crotonobetainyl-CoA:carnitine CoA-transferase CaiB-like acyl-CoA transferase
MNSDVKHDARDFAGVRVLEFADAGIAAAYGGWLLARMGAQVTRLTRPSSAECAATSPVQLALEVLTDGKASAPCPGTASELDMLLAACDIVLCDAPAAFEALSGPVSNLNRRLPRLIVGMASTFGLEGPYAGLPAGSLDAQALSAVSWSMGEAGREPLSFPPGIVEHQAGAMLAAGVLLALAVRDAHGGGRVVDIALADVLASFVAGNSPLYVHHGLRWQRSGRRASGSGGAYPYVILPCKDGQVCVCGRTREEWNRLVQVMGNPEWASQPRYQDLRAMGKQYPDEVDQLVMPWFAEHTMAELEAIALKNNLIVSPIRSFADVLKTQHFRDRGFLIDGHAAGQKVSVPGLPFRILEQRSESASNRALELLRVPAPSSSKGAPGTMAQPLAGLRVLDFGWVWSAPWVGTMLGELGAQVIKVEHGLRLDNLRLSGRVIRDGKPMEGPSKEMSPMFHQINHGKQGITLNAKEPRAVELLKRLAGMSDLVIENMSPGSMERSGLGYESLRAVNPRIVMLGMSAAGQFGALANMRAYAPTMSSFVGMEALVGYTGEAPIGALNFGLGDPNGSVHALVAVLAALRHARATGQGCYIDLSQIEGLLSTLRPYLIASQIQGRQPPTMGNSHPDVAPHGIYPAAGTDAWLTMSATDGAQWQALCRLAEDESWARDARFSTLEKRLAHRAELDAALRGWTATQARDALVGRLRAAGIASTPVLSVEEQWRDPHYAAREITGEVEIPHFGKSAMFKAPWRFSDFAPQVSQCGPLMGQHNDHVFGELLGLSQTEIDDLKQSGVIA